MLETLVVTFMTVCSIGLVVGLIYDRFRKQRTRRLLASRESFDNDAFAHEFFPDSATKAEIAVRLRDVLEANLEMPMSSLHPDDRLDADLYVETFLNPDLFWAIEEEFGVKTSVMDWVLHGHEVEELITFRDLVEYVERKLTGREKLRNHHLQLTGDARDG